MKKTIWFALLAALTLMGCGSDNDQQASMMEEAKKAIVNGVADTTDAHRGVVSLFYTQTNSSICTGTLISPNWVLTASHCVREDNGGVSDHVPYLMIGVGSDENELAQNLYKIEEVIGHEDYYCPIWCTNLEKPTTPDSDIALIKLKNPIPESIAKPILPLPPQRGITRAAIKKGLTVEYVGFGYNENWVSGKKLHVVDNLFDYCGGADNDTGKYCKNAMDEFPWGTIFLQNKKGGTCNGDSGGPALVQVEDTQYVAGVTSYGLGKCKTYSVSTAVQDYFDWILKHVPELASQYNFSPDDDFKFDTIYMEESSSERTTSGKCNDDITQLCVNQFGPGYACIEDKDGMYCGSTCNEGEDRQTCGFYDDDKEVSVTLYDECINSYDDVFVYWTTSYNICDKACNSEGTDCADEVENDTNDNDEEEDIPEITECDDEVTAMCKAQFGDDHACIRGQDDEIYCGEICEEREDILECEYDSSSQSYVVMRKICSNSYDDLFVNLDYQEEECEHGCNEAGDGCAAEPSEDGNSKTEPVDIWDGVESFNGIGKARSYGDRAFVSTDTKFKWQYRTGRPISGDNAIDGDSLILKGESTNNMGSYLTSEDVKVTKNSTIGIDVRAVYKSKKDRIITIEFKAYEPSTQTYDWHTCSSIVVEGENTTSIFCQFPRDPGTDWRIRTEGGQLVLDNFRWKL